MTASRVSPISDETVTSSNPFCRSDRMMRGQRRRRSAWRSPPLSCSSTMRPLPACACCSVAPDDPIDARVLPVAGVDADADGVVAAVAGEQERRDLVGRLGLDVFGVRRPEQERAPARGRFEEALGGVDLEAELLPRDRGDVRVREGVIADLVALVEDAPHDAPVQVGVEADDEKRRRRMLTRAARPVSAASTRRRARRRR